MNPPNSLINSSTMSRQLLIYFIVALSASHLEAKESPFTVKASLIRYWNKHISNNLPLPDFLLSKASPLTVVESAFLSTLASQGALSSHVSALCSSANLFCQLGSSDHPKPRQNAEFSSYTNKAFAKYGAGDVTGTDSFKNYSAGINMAKNTFTHYSASSSAHSEMFTSYGDNANVGDDGFTSYAPGSAGGSGEFTSYESNVNVPDLRFTSYDSSSRGHKLSFANYSGDSNSGKEVFTSYGKSANGVPMEFTNYGETTNILGSTFTGYSELATNANDTFKGYSGDANNPNNNFKSYSVGAKGGGGGDTFVNYRDGANVGHDTFQSYGKSANSAKASFVNYGKSFNQGTDAFVEYGTSSKTRHVDFKSYDVNNTFKGYGDDNRGISFAKYTTELESKSFHGRFFRESMLKQGKVMRMPDIRDKLPKRSFLPRSILEKLEPNDIFGMGDMAAIKKTVEECDHAPSKGETKRCVGSIEDMIDFTVSVLGSDVVVRTTENVNGSGEDVVIGGVRGINGGNVTKSVSCHQSMFPYLLYYCHSVPKVRAYEADILSLEGRVGVNRGVAICHLDTSAWSAGHGAFVALGYGPGRIEVCHWIFENDMTWSVADD